MQVGEAQGGPERNTMLSVMTLSMALVHLQSWGVQSLAVPWQGYWHCCSFCWLCFYPSVAGSRSLPANVKPSIVSQRLFESLGSSSRFLLWCWQRGGWCTRECRRCRRACCYSRERCDDRLGRWQSRRCRWWWCEKCLLITESPKTPGHYRYLSLGPRLHPLYGIGSVQFAIYCVPVHTAISNF